MLLIDAVIALFGLGMPLAAAQDSSPTVALAEDGGEADDPVGKRSVVETLDQPWPTLLNPQRWPDASQVRIERRVIVRISPRPSQARQNLTATSIPQTTAPRLISRSGDNCVPLSSIAGVTARNENHLLLFMRDRRLMTARLEKACSAREFYAGFYLERPEDGQLCVERDDLHARSGAKCSISEFRHLVREEP